MKLKNIALAAGMILSAAVAFADNGTEFGVDDDLTVWGVQGSTADADVKIKGFTVFGSTTAGNLAVYSGTGSVFMGGALEVSSNTYLRGSVVVGTTTSQGIFAVKDNFVVTSDGNVGIGTTNPIAKFQLIGGGAYIGNGSPTNWDYGNGQITLNSTNSDSRLDFGQDSTHYAPMVWRYNATPANAWFEIGTGGNNNPMRFDASYIALQSQSSGNVGIGTTGPGRKLEVSGDVRITGNSQWDFLSDVGSYLLIQNANLGNGSQLTLATNGNVGIGTTNPTNPLTVSGNANVTGTLTAGTFSGSGTAITGLAESAITNLSTDLSNRPTGSGTANDTALWTGTNVLGNGPAIGTAANDLVQLDGSAKLPAVDGSQLTGIAHNKFFTASGSFTAPTGVSVVYLTMCAGGGGGAGANDQSGQVGGEGGGAGGAVIKYPYAVSAGNPYTVTVGAAGIGKAYGAGNATAGTNTGFGTLMLTGGGGGTMAGGCAPHCGPGAAGNISGYTNLSFSASGATPGSSNFSGAAASHSGDTGGGGGATPFGQGGAGGTTSTNGGNATGYGAGGGGGGGGAAGGNGAPGFVLVEW